MSLIPVAIGEHALDSSSYQDWFNEKTQAFWSNEYAIFFDPETGIDIDGAWIDMNEPSSVRSELLIQFLLEQRLVIRYLLPYQFCIDPCTDPFQQAIEGGYPPNRTTPPPDPNASIFGEPPPADVNPNSSLNAGASTLQSRMISDHAWTRRQHAGDDVMNPPYGINNALPQLSDRTAYVSELDYHFFHEFHIYLSIQPIVLRRLMSSMRMV